MQTRSEAFSLLNDYTQSQSLIKHALSVEAAMRWYALHLSKTHPEITELEVEKWGMTGLLHDFDYDRHPEPVSPDGHPYKGNAILQELGYPDDLRKAIMGHALYTNTPRDTLMAKTLFAVDELCGLITACVYVRPDKSIQNLEPRSVLKKMKDKAFARGCSREDIKLGAEELGIELEVHIGNVIEAMKAQAEAPGL